ncbi:MULTISPECIES: ABC transporter ATP-binding protein [Paraburkholderia]|uniref:ABC transporter ATP-binding protein n=1 Tax=Paraburkholderia dipogonis TaxID=1211383 RepID=A0A4Y8MGU7_9BURK|nr:MULTISPECIES: ABC transporter ATP-binding protein [Paraburkholderia]RKR31324.1 amino acid/amide ABC transporter ATP-binding protein 1 (HAAT family) [Paraburkholderia sp. BL17N1]TFE36706.1 ABC transporter ATP-binding protein [Paraburkholderia dipogonis]
MVADNFILETRGLTRVFAGFTAVKSVDLRVRRGSIHSLIGPNGAGKTTCFNLLTKFLAPTAGKIIFSGEDITRAAPAAIARRGVIRSFQISAIYPNLTAAENVGIALQRATKSSYLFWKNSRVLAGLRPRAIELLDEVGLAADADTRAAELPYGSKRALEIATTLAMDPALMLLDEPTQGMGHEDIDRVTSLIKRVAEGRTILMVEHNMKIISSISDTITVLQRGEILAEGNYAQVSTDARVKEAYMGADDESGNS